MKKSKLRKELRNAAKTLSEAMRLIESQEEENQKLIQRQIKLSQENSYLEQEILSMSRDIDSLQNQIKYAESALDRKETREDDIAEFTAKIISAVMDE